jgi:transposase
MRNGSAATVTNGVHTMQNNITIGLDLAKTKFHTVTLNSLGKKVSSEKIVREQMFIHFSSLQNKAQTLIAMEACSGCHYWANALKDIGFNVELLKTKDIKPYAKSRQKNDTNDALAIAKAARDPELKRVKIKNKYEQEIAFLHKTRSNTISERVSKTNSLISSLHECGYVSKLGKSKFARNVFQEIERAFKSNCLSPKLRDMMLEEAQEITQLLAKEGNLDKMIIAENKKNDKATNLQNINGIGAINASILSISSMEVYETGRDFAASLGLVPRQNTTGGKVVLGGISKQGDRYKRTMLIQGGRSVLMRAMMLKKNNKTSDDPLVLFAQKLLQQNKPFNVIAVAIANKMARIAWATTVKNRIYNQKPEQKLAA